MEFNDIYSAARENDYVLRVSWGNMSYYYDFAARQMTTITAVGQWHMATTPFSQIDRETLITMRDKLVDLKGKPPELPPEAPVQPSSAGKLRL
jgi:hypothetical protein